MEGLGVKTVRVDLGWYISQVFPACLHPTTRSHVTSNASETTGVLARKAVHEYMCVAHSLHWLGACPMRYYRGSELFTFIDEVMTADNL